MKAPQKEEYSPYFQPYVDQAMNAEGESLLEKLAIEHRRTQELLNGLTEEQGDYRYAEGKWSIKELIQHLIDSERVFAYRAMRFARNDKTDLPGFDHDNYVPESQCDRLTLTGVLQEFQVVRAGSIALFASFSDEIMARTGTANGNPMSVNAAAFLILGHEMHHRMIIQERYL